MGGGEAALWLLDFAVRETMLAAAIGFLVGGVDDLIVDLIWIARTLWRGATIYRRFTRADAGTLAPAERPGRIVVFVPAWDESQVIGAMLRNTLDRFAHGDYRIYVGAYPNDPATIAAVEAVGDARIRCVTLDDPGPTTKADCLNALWRALVADEAREGVRAKCVVLHDAEDVVHSAELAVFDRMIERFDVVQLPVYPLVDPRHRWIAGHYLDEFAESHGKELVVREAVGAALPLAGVGCAIARDAIGRLADSQGGLPFDRESLTEDYEIGLKLHAMGCRGAFVRLPGGHGRRRMVATREHFPGTVRAAVAQKARWMAGIALNGWDRLGWSGNPAEIWMRLRDRRAPAAALVLLTGYLSALLFCLSQLAHALHGSARPPLPPAMDMLFNLVGLLALWRLSMRFGFTTYSYGWREGLRAVPRTVVANFIAMLAARRALSRYLAARRSTSAPRWDKTRHEFPDVVPAE